MREIPPSDWSDGSFLDYEQPQGLRARLEALEIGSPSAPISWGTLAGELVDGERVTPPCFHDAYTWIEEDWDKFGWELPKVRP